MGGADEPEDVQVKRLPRAQQDGHVVRGKVCGHHVRQAVSIQVGYNAAERR